MTTCFVCANSALGLLPMQNKDVLLRGARDFIQGMAVCAAQTGKGSLRSFQPRTHRGVLIVERCARLVETLCGGCRRPECPRRRIAAELRASADRIYEEREAELLELGFDDEDIEESIDKIVGSLCEGHAPFGTALAEQWYSRRSFLQQPSSLMEAL